MAETALELEILLDRVEFRLYVKRIILSMLNLIERKDSGEHSDSNFDHLSPLGERSA
jgi:hypothetical protein